MAHRLSSCNFAYHIEGELAFLGVARDFNDRFVQAHAQILRQTSPTLRWCASDCENVRRLKRQESHGSVKIVRSVQSLLEQPTLAIALPPLLLAFVIT